MFFIFVNNNLFLTKSKIHNTNYFIDSITELFPAANWLEREAAELSGINFSGKKDLRNLIGLVSQDSILFNDSISNNIKLSSFNNNEEDVKKSAIIANANDFIDKLENKYESNVIDVSAITHGVYLLKIYSGERSSTKKIVIN